MQANGIPEVRPVSDLRANMSGIMEAIDTQKQHVVLTKHGRGKYVLMSIEEYNTLSGRNALYKAIDEGLKAIQEGDYEDFNTFATQLEEDIQNGKI